MHSIDIAVVCVYLLATVVVGALVGGRPRGVRDYFLTRQGAPWWAVMASIVATETSTVTLISVPGFAFGGNLTFLQLALGYIVGRVLVSVIFIPGYFRGELLTSYQVVTRRLGAGVGRLAASIFVVTRTLADGFRLFATGLVMAAVLGAVPGGDELARRLLPGAEPVLALIVIGVLVVGGATMIYTFVGGMTAVIWTDVAQLIVYLGGSILAAAVLVEAIPGGWREVVEVAGRSGKLTVFDFSADPTRSYTLWAGVVGGAFLTAATHGTDQIIVQRYLCSRTERHAVRALLVSGVVVAAQFALFLGIGLMLHVYYTQYDPASLAALTRNGDVQTDRVFPLFIVTHLPIGARGLVVAAMFAAAMSTLSSSLNSSASSLIADFYLPLTGRRRSQRHYLAVARGATLACGVAQMGVALVAIQVSSRVVDEVLGIASFTNGIVLGIFLLGTITDVEARSALAGVAAGTAGMLAIRLFTGVSWQWYVLVGSLGTLLVGWLVDRLTRTGATNGRADAV